MKTATEKLNVNKMFGGTFYLLEPQTKNTSFAELKELFTTKMATFPEQFGSSTFHSRISLQH